jgi:hypothetical protein
MADVFIRVVLYIGTSVRIEKKNQLVILGFLGFPRVSWVPSIL